MQCISFQDRILLSSKPWLLKGKGPLSEPKDKTLRRDGQNVNSGWLQVIENEPPRFSCPVMGTELMGPCSLRGCPLWSSNHKVYCCVGAFASMKAANSEERLSATSATQREKRGTLRSASEGKLSFHDLSAIFGLSRQRVEGYVSFGRQIIETLTPRFSEIDLSADGPDRPAKRRIGSPTLFTHTSPVAHTDPKTGDTTRVCMCCESIIEPDDSEVVLAYLERAEVAWCSRECAKEFPMDAFLVSHRYKRHWASIALPQENDEIDERSRVREITTERMGALRELARKQGYVG